MPKKVKPGILLDIGCGDSRRPGFTRLDMREEVEPDILHNLEEIPYPLGDESCITVVGSHIIEHVKPWLMLDIMNEIWRILRPAGQLALSMPYAGSRGYWQDPTHCNGCNEVTWQYFDPRFGLYQIYKPKPWRIDAGFPLWRADGNMEVVMSKSVLMIIDEEMPDDARAEAVGRGNKASGPTC